MDRITHDRGLVIEVGLWHADGDPPGSTRRHPGQLSVNIGELSVGGSVATGTVGSAASGRTRASALVSRGGDDSVSCPKDVSRLVAELDSSLGELTDDGTGLRRGNSRLVKGIAKASGRDRKPSTAAALDQLVHVWVVVSSSSRAASTVAVLGMRHRPSWAHIGHALDTAPRQARLCTGGDPRRTWQYAPLALSCNARGG